MQIVFVLNKVIGCVNVIIVDYFVLFFGVCKFYEGLVLEDVFIFDGYDGEDDDVLLCGVLL